jgi:hypothetical protein
LDIAPADWKIPTPFTEQIEKATWAGLENREGFFKLRAALSVPAT